MSVTRKLARVRDRALQRRLPQVFTLTDLDPLGIRLEASNIVERHRILSYGDEPEFLGAMLDALRADDVLYDIGANVGLVALHAARKSTTIAFEPDPEFLARLRRNVQLNPSVSVEILPVAVSDSNGRVTLYTDGAQGNSPSLVRQDAKRGSVDVKAQTLDSIVAEGGLPLPTVLKIDIEGAEVLALRGARDVLHGRQPPRALFLEVHDGFLPAFGSSGDEVLEIVRDAGYTEMRYEARRFDQRHLILGRS